MLKNNKKEKFSLRKYKDGRTDSKLIGATLLVGMGLLASGGTALANVSSNGVDTATMVTDTSKKELLNRQKLTAILVMLMELIL